MLKVNYTDKTGTYTIYGGIVPDPAIVNGVQHVCDYCMDVKVNGQGEICLECIETIAHRIDKAEHQNRCDW